MPGPDCAAIFIEAPIEDVVHGLDGPVAAIECEEAFWGGGLAGQAGDAVGGLAAAFSGGLFGGFAAHREDLGDAREGDMVVEFA